MIFNTTVNAGNYLGISPNLDKAFTFLLQTDLSALPNGRHEIDGDRVFVNLMDAETNPDENRPYEFHHRYYDIQIDLEGEEEIRFATEAGTITKPYQDDIGFADCECAVVCKLGPGRFALCEPGEPHLPGIAPQHRTQSIRKAVIKVAV